MHGVNAWCRYGGDRIDLIHSQIMSQTAYLDAIYVSDFVSYMQYLLSEFQTIISQRNRAIKMADLERTSIKSFYSGLTLLMGQYQDNMQDCMKMINAVFPTEYRIHRNYQSDVKALLPNTMATLKKYPTNISVFLDHLYYSLSEKSDFPSGNKQTSTFVYDFNSPYDLWKLKPIVDTKLRNYLQKSVCSVYYLYFYVGHVTSGEAPDPKLYASYLNEIHYNFQPNNLRGGKSSNAALSRIFLDVRKRLESQQINEPKVSTGGEYAIPQPPPPPPQLPVIPEQLQEEELLEEEAYDWDEGGYDNNEPDNYYDDGDAAMGVLNNDYRKRSSFNESSYGPFMKNSRIEI